MASAEQLPTVADATAERMMANFRDLGGLSGRDGRVTRHGVLWRSDAPYVGDLPPVDAGGWPPHLVLDLREPFESAAEHPLHGDRTTVLPVPLLDAVHADQGGWRAVRLEPLYRGALQRTAAVLPEVLERVVSASGPVLVHCAAGKDRTGVLVAVLLRAAGVSRGDVLEDYLRTGENMPAVMARMEWDTSLLGEEDRLLAQHLAGTSLAAVTEVLDALEQADGGVAGWLAANGVSEHLRARWERRLLG